MTFNKEQRKAHYEANKEIIKQKRRERYLASKKGEQNPKSVLPKNVLPNEVEQKEGGQFVLPNFVKPEVEQLGEVEQNVSPVLDLISNVLPNSKQIAKPCPRCPEIENSISNFANLYQQEQKKVKQLQKTIKELEQPINPTIEL